jgi:hypothetical protein
MADYHNNHPPISISTNFKLSAVVGREIICSMSLRYHPCVCSSPYSIYRFPKTIDRSKLNHPTEAEQLDDLDINDLYKKTPNQ